MFGGRKDVHPLNIFKWKWHKDSSLTTGLLNDVSCEIELSDYQKAPSLCSESPSGLLDGENLDVEPIEDLDLFFERVYSYYCEKGLWCIIIKWVFELLSLAFTICFSGFFLLYVDWNGLRNAKCGMDAVESGIKPCDLSKEALHEHPLTPFTISKAVILGYLGLFLVYWLFCFLRFFSQLKETLKIRQFYQNSLNVTDNELPTMPWALILEKVVRVQNVQQLWVGKDLSVHDAVMRLMRKENYLIGMLNKGVLALPIPSWVPGSGPAVSVGPSGPCHRPVLPKTLEWTLNWCILQSMFDRNYRIRRDFVLDPETLKKRLMIVGFALFLLSPFIVIFMLVYLFLRHAEQFYNHPSMASSRRWSNLSKWIFREFNEVDHLFKHRMNSAVVHASNYLKQFPSPVLTIVAKFISFVCGGFAAVLIIIAFLEESLLEGHIFGRNLLWYAAVFGTITAISRAAMMDELLVLDPQGTMSLLGQHTHYMPKRWRGKEFTESVRLEFETLFQYTGMMLLEEMASIFLTPYLLLFVVPQRVEDMLQFIADFTVDVEGVGHVCSFSLFDFKNHGNRRYGSPYDTPRRQRSSQGKMEKSSLSFRITYPSWEPDNDGKKFLASLKTFRDQKLQGKHQNHLNPRGPSDPNSFFSREAVSPFTNHGSFHQFDSMWLIDGEEKNFPYILDWFYSSHNHSRDDDFRDVPSTHHTNDEQNPNNIWMPPQLTKHEEKYDDNWNSLLETRVQSHLEASISTPLFQESILHHHDSNNIARDGRSHWWARTRPKGPGPETSFLEPPNFNKEVSDSGRSHWWARTRPQGPGPKTSFLEPLNFNKEASDSGDYYENDLDRSVEEQERQLDLRSSRGLSRTFYMDDLGGGDFDLPFVDEYRGPSDSVINNADPMNIV